MTENKTELIKLILENDNPEQAVMTAAAIILGLLMNPEASEEQVSAEQVSADLQISGQTRPSYVS